MALFYLPEALAIYTIQLVMTLDQLHNRYPKHPFDAFSMGKRHRAFRYRLYGPKLQSIVGNKIAYMEARILCVAKVEDIDIDENGFSALVVPVLDSADGDNPQDRPRAPLLWKFGTCWSMLCSTRQHFYAHYVGWRFWTDPEYSETIENLLKEKGQVAAVSYLFRLAWGND